MAVGDGVFLSDLGRVFGRRVWPGKNGYPAFSVCGQKYQVHREVARLFLPRVEGAGLVRHLNDDRTDNRAANLAWGTHAQNHADAARNRLFKTRLSAPMVRAARSLAREGYRINGLAALFEVSFKGMKKAVVGDTWAHLEGSDPLDWSEYSPSKKVPVVRIVGLRRPTVSVAAGGAL